MRHRIGLRRAVCGTERFDVSLFAELKRRNVFRVGTAYLVSAWLLLQVADIVLENIGAPGWVMQVFMLLLAIGLPVALILAWAFELTPEGVKRESEVDRSESITPQTGQKLNRIIIAMLVLAVGLLLAERLTPSSRQAANVASGQAELERLETDAVTAMEAKLPAPVSVDDRTVAVLPFLNLSSDPEQEYFADGLTEEILNSLAQLPELKVTARTSAFHFKGKDQPVEKIAATLGVAHIVEGSVRTSGGRVRITAQLIRAADGFHLWSDTYDDDLEDTFALQTDIAANIALALQVVMDEDKRRQMEIAGVRDPEAFVAFQKAQELDAIAHGSANMIPELRASSLLYERAIELAPRMAVAYRYHSDLFAHLLIDYASGRPTPDFGPDDVAAAQASMEADFRAAMEYAPNERAREAAELDLMVVTGKWRGLAAQVDRVLAQPGCNYVVWSQLVSSAFDRAAGMIDYRLAAAECDPLQSRNWTNGVWAALWDGQTAMAVEIGERATSLVDHSWLWGVYARSLAAAGDSDRARVVANTWVRDDNDRLQVLAMLAAMDGDAESLATTHEEWRRRFGPDDFREIVFAAWAGNRAEANRNAARVDARPAGHMALLLSIYFCLCAAPFDISATPDFAAKFEQSGLPWPTARPISLPLKDW
jgi:TolB-like protein